MSGFCRGSPRFLVIEASEVSDHSVVVFQGSECINLIITGSFLTGFEYFQSKVVALLKVNIMSYSIECVDLTFPIWSSSSSYTDVSKTFRKDS